MPLPWLVFGAALGLGAGLTPGPLLALVISESARGGWRSGVLVAVAPLITDLPIALLAILLAFTLPEWGLSVLGAAGGLLLLYLGAGMARETTGRSTTRWTGSQAVRSSLWRGVAANALNPHPYLFWTLVGAPSVAMAQRQGLLATAGFVVGFYVCLVGSKIALAIAVGRGVTRLREAAHRGVVLAAALALAAAGLVLLVSSLGL